MATDDHSHLPRLHENAYKGLAAVHWTLTIKDRKRGWLTDRLHLRVREQLLHALARYGAVCPVYCMMPDHAHLLILGSMESCDQLNLMRFFRKYTAPVLGEVGLSWQKQAHDNVLRQKDRERGAFEAVASYIAENPVRGMLVGDRNDWEFVGGLVPGYPDLGFKTEMYWETFWKVYDLIAERE